MPSERVQRRIDRLLDQAEEAADSADWSKVLEFVRGAIALDAGNGDALSFKEMAEQALGGDSGSPSESNGTAQSAVFNPVDDAPSTSPTSFASGRYTVSKFLGEGGKKKVYLAHDNTLDRDVAFALIKTEGLDDTSRERVTREAQAMGRMGTHPCIMPIYDLGEEPDANGVAQPFMVQPLMGGGDVEGLIEDADGPLELEDAIRIATQTAQGLVFAHGKGIVHRDLKPGNVWLEEDGSARIGDFGLAIATDRSRLTVEKMMVGTVNYMPPEQATGGEVTPKADLYSLGAMLYEMCSGRVPFMGDDDIAVISQHVNTPPVAPSWHNPLIPKTLDSLILRMMSKDPAERPADADEVLAALNAVDLSAVEERDESGKGSLDAMAGGVFVGRHKEMDQLKAGFEEVLSGKGRMVTLVGEPGIGKTRTAQELATYAAMRGAEVLWGRSYESGGAPPYWPWVQAIRNHVAATDETALRTQMGSTAPVIAEIVSDIREKLSELPEPKHIEDPESARFRLFDSVSTFLKNTASSTPLVLMLEDLHWADKPSLMLLEFVARELSNSRIMIVGNYRDMELNRRHPLSVTLGDLSRERLFERVVLRGLQKHDVHRFIEIAAGITPPTALVDTVFRQTEGNPLFVTETVRLLIQEGDITSGTSTSGGTTSWEIRIPEGVREVIGRRLDRLTERTNEVLTIAAVVGRRFRFPVLKMLMEDTTDGQLLDAMDEALSARIIEELPEEIGLYQFTHAQMQETLIGELSVNRLVRMHARIAEGLEEYWGEVADEHATELLEHFTGSETVLGPDKLLKYSILAAQESRNGFAHERTLQIVESAIGLIDSSQPSEQLAELLMLKGESIRLTSTLGGMQQAWDTVVQASEMFFELGNSSQGIRALNVPVAAAFVRGTIEPTEKALQRVDPNTFDAQLLRIRHALGRFYENAEYESAIEELQEVLEWSRRTNTVNLQTRTLGVLASFYFLTCDYENALEFARLGAESASSSDWQDEWWSGQSSSYAALALIAMGRPEEALPHLEHSLQLVDRMRDRTLQSAVRLHLLMYHGLLGDNAKLRRIVREFAGFAVTDTSQAPGFSIDTFLNLLDDKHAEARKHLEGWNRMHADAPQAGTLALLNANSLSDFGASAESSGFADIIDRSDAFLGNHYPPQATANRMACLVLLKEANSEDMDWAAAERSLEPASGFALSGSTIVADRALAISHFQRGQLQLSEQHFGGAIQFARAAGYRPELARACMGLSELLLTRNAPGDHEKAIELQDEAIAIATELSMKPLLERVLAKREILKA